jgi:hypothetical protein
MNQVKKRLIKFFVWGLLAAAVIGLGIFTVPVLVHLFSSVDSQYQLIIEISVLVLIIASVAGIVFEVRRNRHSETVREKAEHEAIVLEIGASELGMNLLGTDARGSIIRDPILLDVYNSIVQTAIATTVDSNTALYQEPVNDIGHPLVTLPVPSAPASVRTAYSYHKSQRPRWLRLLVQCGCGKDYGHKNVLWGLGVTCSTIPAAYNFCKSPRSQSSIHWFVANFEKSDSASNQQPYPQPEEDILNENEINFDIDEPFNIASEPNVTESEVKGGTDNDTVTVDE